MVNDQSNGRYVARFGVPADRIVIVPYPTDPSFSKAPLNPICHQPTVLLYVGQLIERKGLLQFLSVLRKWAEAHPGRRIELRLAGEGPLQPALEQSRQPPNILLRFLGPVSYPELPGIYAEADIFVFPTLADEWGAVINEAMAAGVPVLGSLYSQAVAELVRHGENGWTFFPNQRSDVYDALDSALKTPEKELYRMRQAARVEALKLCPPAVANRIVAAVNAVLAQS
jgi:glycosyltransferase involved in cell wall biosynthesis